MKSLKIISIAIFAMLFVSCGEQPTQPNYNKYLIQLDTNWIEVFDIDTIPINIGSYWSDNNLLEHEIIIKNEDDYKSLFIDAVKIAKQNNHIYWDTTYKEIAIDFNQRFIVSYGFAGADYGYTRKVFFNKDKKEYLYLLEIKFLSPNKPIKAFLENISIPVLAKEFKITFDTLRINFPY